MSSSQALFDTQSLKSVTPEQAKHYFNIFLNGAQEKIYLALGDLQANNLSIDSVILLTPPHLLSSSRINASHHWTFLNQYFNANYALSFNLSDKTLEYLIEHSKCQENLSYYVYLNSLQQASRNYLKTENLEKLLSLAPLNINVQEMPHIFQDKLEKSLMDNPLNSYFKKASFLYEEQRLTEKAVTGLIEKVDLNFCHNNINEFLNTLMYVINDPNLVTPEQLALIANKLSIKTIKI